MTVILKLKEPLESVEPNSKHGYVVELFDTVEDFKVFIREQLFEIRRSLKKVSMEDKELDRLLNDSTRMNSFHEIYEKYLEYEFDYTFEII